MTLAERALEFVKDGEVVGLGTGRAATAFVRALGIQVQAGLQIRAIPTSQVTTDLARELCIPLTTFEFVDTIDVAVDGADEVDPQLNLIKGYGGALVREKIVAVAAKQFVVLVGTEKLVSVLGGRGRLPVEVVPFGVAACLRRLRTLSSAPTARQTETGLFVSDNGNAIIDCGISSIARPAEFEQKILSIPGVVGTGLFVGMAHTVLVQDGETVQVRERNQLG